MTSVIGAGARTSCLSALLAAVHLFAFFGNQGPRHDRHSLFASFAEALATHRRLGPSRQIPFESHGLMHWRRADVQSRECCSRAAPGCMPRKTSKRISGFEVDLRLGLDSDPNTVSRPGEYNQSFGPDSFRTIGVSFDVHF